MAAPKTRSHLLCKFHIVSNQPNKHPLHLQINQDNCSTLFDNTEDSTIIIALESCQHGKPFTGSTRLFVVLEKTSFLEEAPVQETGKDALNSPEQYGSIHTFNYENILMCTQQFLTHYGFSVEDDIVVRPVQTFPLTKVVLAATSDRALAWAQHKFFSTGLVLSVCQQTVLIRQQDMLLAPYNILFSKDDDFDMGVFSEMQVVTCEPVQQGRLSVNTELIIVHDEPCQDILKTSINQVQDLQRNLDEIKTGTDFTEPFLLSDFTFGIKEPDIVSNTCILNNEKCMDNGEINESKSNNNSNTPVHLSIIDSTPEMFSMLNLDGNVDEHDLDSMVGVSGRTMCALGLFDGSLADIEIYKTNLKIETDEPQSSDRLTTDVYKSRFKGTGKRTVKVHVANGKDVQDDVVYMAPGLSFNIYKKSIKQGKAKTRRMTVKKSFLSYEIVPQESSEDSSSSLSWKGAVPFAREVHVSVVNSPLYAISINTNELLKQYFTTPRLVKNGDTLSISARLDVDYYGEELSDGSGSRQPVVYFRVLRIEPLFPYITNYFVDITHTVLFQDGAVNSYVPVMMQRLLHGDVSVLPPPGMTKTTEEIVNTLRPHLHHRRKPNDPVPSMLLIGQDGSGKKMIIKAVAAALNLHLYKVNAHELCGDTSSSTEARVKAMMTRATTYAPCILQLRNIHVFGKAADGSTEEPRTASAFHEIVQQALTDHDKWPVIIVATTAHPKKINADLYEGFLHQTTLQVPIETERRQMLEEMFEGVGTIGTSINLPRIAQRTAGFVIGDMYALLGQAHRHARSRIFTYCSTDRRAGLCVQEEEDLVMAGVELNQQDFEAALDDLQSAHSDFIGAPKIPHVSWDDVGGLVSVKSDILDTIQLPLLHPELLSAGLRRSGVLLYGPPGTGKTLLAKAVATECSLNFLSVKGPELINMYVGQSEENVREVFQRARSASPCVIFFDELDSLAPNRGRSGDSGGVMDRVVSQLLAELDGMSKVADVFVIGATNRPDLLDPALLRPGRFDKLLYLGVAADRDSQLKILTALTRKFVLASGCSLDRVVDQCPINMTGADFYALCSDAMLNALKGKITLLDKGEAVDQTHVEIEEDDFADALATLVPSVSLVELARFEALQKEFNSQKHNERPQLLA